MLSFDESHRPNFDMVEIELLKLDNIYNKKKSVSSGS